MITDLNIVDLSAGINNSIAQAVEKMELSWTIDAVSQIRVTLFDPNLDMMRANYFQKRRIATYKGVEFEIATLEVGPRVGSTAQVTIELRRSAIQRIKRDKNPSAYSGVSATDYARIVAARHNLEFVGQPTSTKGTITQSGSATKRESVWDVLGRIAGEAKFAIFESNGTLFFASEEWLLGKREFLLINYPSKLTDPYILLDVPTCRWSDDDEQNAEIQMVLNRTNAIDLRPGMTVAFNGVPTFEGYYLISEVAYEEGTEEPVSVSMRTPEKTED